MRNCLPLLSTILTGLVLFQFCAAPAEAAEEGLQAQLRALAAEQGFLLQGAEKVGDAPAPLAAGSLTEQLEALLQGYNYMLLSDDGGAVQELRILGRRGPVQTGPRRFTLKTTRQGAHQLVDAELVGATPRARLHLSLIVDTGATTLVLPVGAGTSLPIAPSKATTGRSRPFQLIFPSIQFWLPSFCTGGVYRTTSATHALGTIRRSSANGTSKL